MEDSVEYVYDPYGKLLEVKQPKNDSIGFYNPLIYKDYIYDFDTELYYLQSRYYDPEVGRFLNGDGYASTGQDIDEDKDSRTLSCAYLNSAVVAKKLGHDTISDAARAFSDAVYSSSLYIRHEYGTEIYAINLPGRTVYNFNPPTATAPHSTRVSYATPPGTKIVAYAHTHPNSNEFSPKDIEVAHNMRIDAYVVGPNLNLQRYSVTSKSTTSIGSISSIALTSAQRASLVAEFQVSWNAHISVDCDFNCSNMLWSTP